MSEEATATRPEVEMNPHAQETQSPVVVSVEDLVGSIADNDLVTGGKQLADLLAAKVDAALEAEKVAIADIAFNGAEVDPFDGLKTDPGEEVGELDDEVEDVDLEVSDEEIQAEVDAIFAEED